MSREPDETSAEIDAALIGVRKYTSRQVAAMAGVPVYRARRFWRALGFPNVGETALEFTDVDLQALRTIVRLTDCGALDEATVVQLARSLGQAAGRLADSEVDLAGRELEITQAPAACRAQPVEWLVRTVLPDLQHLLVYSWQRHLAATAARAADSWAPVGSSAVAFADLVGFTRWSRRMDLIELADMVARFESRAADVVAHCGGRLIKTQGDSVLFAATTPYVAAQTALALLDAHRTDRAAPALRVGLAYGPVIFRMGDVFGATVNLASRLTAIAEADSAVMDSDMALALRASDFRVDPLPACDLAGIGRVAQFRLGSRCPQNTARPSSPRAPG